MSARDARARTRNAVLTIAVVAAIAAVWAVGLGVVDRSVTPSPRRYATSPTARIERRPALFVFERSPDAPDNQSAVSGHALPVALVEPNGALRPPFDDPAPAADGRPQLRAFQATYCAPGSQMEILSGGAVAGTLAFDAPDPRGGSPDVWVRGSCQLSGGADPALNGDGLWLAISDRRFGRASSGASPMRAAHRAAVEQMTRRLLKERFPDRRVEEEGPARVRVADLDHAGQPEVLATRTVRLRDAAGRVAEVAMFLVGEAQPDSDAYRATYAVTFESDGAEDGGYDYVDQIDLTSSPFDEIVIRRRAGDVSWYAVLRRDDEAWREAYTAGPIRAPGRSSR